MFWVLLAPPLIEPTLAALNQFGRNRVISS
jgi:hypothetical protein